MTDLQGVQTFQLPSWWIARNLLESVIVQVVLDSIQRCTIVGIVLSYSYFSSSVLLCSRCSLGIPELDNEWHVACKVTSCRFVVINWIPSYSVYEHTISTISCNILLCVRCGGKVYNSAASGAQKQSNCWNIIYQLIDFWHFHPTYKNGGLVSGKFIQSVERNSISQGIIWFGQSYWFCGFFDFNGYLLWGTLSTWTTITFR